MGNCFYCNLREDERRSLDDEDSLTLLYFIRDKIGYNITAFGEDIASVKINYCPFCGRRLK